MNAVSGSRSYTDSDVPEILQKFVAETGFDEAVEVVVEAILRRVHNLSKLANASNLDAVLVRDLSSHCIPKTAAVRHAHCAVLAKGKCLLPLVVCDVLSVVAVKDLAQCRLGRVCDRAYSLPSEEEESGDLDLAIC